MIEDWKKVKELGLGGQGKVWLVEKEIELEESKAELLAVKFRQIQNDLMAASQFSVDSKELGSVEGSVTTTKKKPKAAIQSLIASIRDVQHQINDIEQPSGAMKELHKPEHARDAGSALNRFQNEVGALKKIEHPNVLKVLDVDIEKFVFVSPFYARGTIGSQSHRFSGKPLEALRFMRIVVDAVAAIHDIGYVHRDLKPENIFLDNEGQPIIGDFGLVIASDEDNRLSQTYDNVGSRDWMPGWAQSIRYDEVTPAFDVFSLGKILYSLISGKPKLQLWYFNRSKFNLTELFPGNRQMLLINQLLAKTIVEDEQDCLKDARDLLHEIDGTIVKLESNAQVLSRKISRRCSVCAVGTYKVEVDGSPTAGRNFGISGAGTQAHLIYVCSNCGHTQIFSGSNHGDGIRLPEGWTD